MFTKRYRDLLKSKNKPTYELTRLYFEDLKNDDLIYNIVKPKNLEFKKGLVSTALNETLENNCLSNEIKISLNKFYNFFQNLPENKDNGRKRNEALYKTDVEFYYVYIHLQIDLISYFIQKIIQIYKEKEETSDLIDYVKLNFKFDNFFECINKIGSGILNVHYNETYGLNFKARSNEYKSQLNISIIEIPFLFNKNVLIKKVLESNLQLNIGLGNLQGCSQIDHYTTLNNFESSEHPQIATGLLFDEYIKFKEEDVFKYLINKIIELNSKNKIIASSYLLEEYKDYDIKDVFKLKEPAYYEENIEIFNRLEKISKLQKIKKNSKKSYLN